MSIDSDEIIAMARDHDPDEIISDADLVGYFNVILGAFGVHAERERIRRGLWKASPAVDQARMIKIKSDRIMRTLEDPAPTQEQLDNAVEELRDIINYSVFAVRKIEGTA